MKIIENKKLFGKINLIDILIAVVILVVGLFAYKTIFRSEATVNIGAKYFTTTCVIKLDGLPSGASKYLEVGSDVYDNETNVYIGKLVEFRAEEYKVVSENNEAGEYVEAVIPNSESVFVKLEVNVSDQGSDLITANNYFIKVGKRINLRSKNFAGGGYLINIDREAK